MSVYAYYACIIVVTCITKIYQYEITMVTRVSLELACILSDFFSQVS